MIVAALTLASGDVMAVQSGLLTNVHLSDRCAGENCWVHSPSEHHMVSWPIDWGAETRTAHRLCSHGTRHPDPDDVSFNARTGRDVTRHQCDGCC